MPSTNSTATAVSAAQNIPRRRRLRRALICCRRCKRCAERRQHRKQQRRQYVEHAEADHGRGILSARRRGAVLRELLRELCRVPQLRRDFLFRIAVRQLAGEMLRVFVDNFVRVRNFLFVQRPRQLRQKFIVIRKPPLRAGVPESLKL